MAVAIDTVTIQIFFHPVDQRQIGIAAYGWK
jgi:hypothetical protein